MKRILFCFSFILCFSMLLINSYASDSDNCDIGFDFIDPSTVIEEEYRGYNPYSGNSTLLNLGTQNGGCFQYIYQKIYFKFYSSERQFIKLNYSGNSAALRVYNYNYFNSSDYLFYSTNINSDTDIIYCDNSQWYLLEFQSTYSGLWIMNLNLEKITFNNLNDYSKYILHLKYVDNFVGYRYDIEYYNLSETTSTNTASYCNNLGATTSYYDLIDNDLNFGITNDSRYLVDNSLASQYSSIAYHKGNVKIPNGSSFTIATGNGTSTFVDDTTVIGCAHSFYIEWQGKTGLASGVKYYPGANSYQDSTNWNGNFGEYIATDTFLPIEYLFYSSNILKAQSDWSITLTYNSTQGLYNHSYMGMSVPSVGNHSNIHSTGYPGLAVNHYDFNQFHYSLWTSYPISNVINIPTDDVIYSTSIVITEGNSGGPLYQYNEGSGTGQSTLLLFGICSSFYIPYDTFIASYFTKLKHFIINLYMEVV